MRNIGAPNSAARWLSENIQAIDPSHQYALMQYCDTGEVVLVTSGTKEHCMAQLTDSATQIPCELGKYRGC